MISGAPASARSAGIQLRWTIEDWPHSSGDGTRGFNKALRDSCVAAMEVIKKEILPLHFTWAGARRYGYQVRSKKYTDSPEKCGKPPLVLSGNTRSAALASSRVQVQIGGKKGTHLRVLFVVPDYIVYHRRERNRQIRTDREIQALDRSDLELVVGLIETELQKRIDAKQDRMDRRAGASFKAESTKGFSEL